MAFCSGWSFAFTTMFPMLMMREKRLMRSKNSPRLWYVPSSSMLMGHSACSSLVTTGAGLKSLMVRFDCTASVCRLRSRSPKSFSSGRTALQAVEARLQVGHLRPELRQLAGGGHALVDVRAERREALALHLGPVGRHRVQVVEGRHAGDGQRDKQPDLGVPRQFVQAQVHGVTFVSGPVHIRLYEPCTPRA